MRGRLHHNYLLVNSLSDAGAPLATASLYDWPKNNWAENLAHTQRGHGGIAGGLGRHTGVDTLADCDCRECLPGYLEGGSRKFKNRD